MSDTAYEPPQRQAWAAVAVGSLAMTVTGLLPLVLGAMVAAHSITADEARAATLSELFAMGVGVGVAGSGLLLRPTYPRRLGMLAAAGYALLTLASVLVHGPAIIALRIAAGLASGLLIWITISMLARRGRPEGWAAAFFMSQAVGVLVAAAIVAALVLPAFGPTGGLAACAGLALMAVPASLMLPQAYPALPGGPAPSPRGLLGLLALLLYVTASTGVWFHMRDFARAAGLAEALASVAVVATLAGQIAGAAFAVLAHGRVRFVHVFAGVCALTLGAWTVLTLHPSALVFEAAITVSGFASMVLGTSLFSFLAKVDPTRRAAAISAAAQLTGAAIGPVIGADLWVSAALVLTSLALVAWLQRPAVQRVALAT